MDQLLGQGNQQAQDRSYQPHAINVNVFVKLYQVNEYMQLSIDPEIPFNVFVNGIKEHILAQRMREAQYEETIEYQLENGSNLQQSEARTLQQLGFTNNCTLYVRLRLQQGTNCQHHRITVNVKIHLKSEKIWLPLSFYPNSSFKFFKNLIDEIILKLAKGRLDGSINIFYLLEQTLTLEQNETRSLQQLGFTEDCNVDVSVNQFLVNVVVNLQQANQNLQQYIDPEIPFNVFVNGIKEQIFVQRMQAQYEETIEYKLENGSNLYQTEARTLQSLGFTNNCTLYVRLKLKGSQ